MKFKPGDLVTYKEFDASQRGGNRVMMVVDRMSRLKNEGDYYRLLDRGSVTICHSTALIRWEGNEDSN